MPELRIVVHSHHFLVTDISAKARTAVDDFARQYVQFGLVKQNYPPYRFEHKPIRVFAAANYARTEYRFHINLLKNFINAITSVPAGRSQAALTEAEIVLEKREFKPPERVEMKIQPQWEDRGDQPLVIDYLTSEKSPLSKFVNLQTGKGKAQPLDALVRTPGGWTTMGNLKVGDMVIAPDGTPTPVVQIHPQGIQPIFRVTFSDGRSAECTQDHLWEVFYVNTTQAKRWRVVNTAEMQRLLAMPNPRVYVRLIKPEASPDIELPINPYVLGAILGDGHVGKTILGFTTADEFMASKLRKLLPSSIQLAKHNCSPFGYSFCRASDDKLNPYLEILGNLGLRGKLSHQKFIPAQYLESSPAQRLQLLQGLLDTDGTAGKEGSVSYATTSENLANQVQYLVRSLGGWAAIYSRIPRFTHRGESRPGRLAYKVSIRYPKPTELFALPRKQARVSDENQYAKTLKLRVMGVEATEAKEAQCISIAHEESLYVTNNFVVTHNSYCTMRAMSEAGVRTLIVVRPMYMQKWADDLYRTFEFKLEDVMQVSGGVQLKALLQLALDRTIGSKVVIISNKTMQNWLKDYEQFGSQLADMGYACLPVELYEKTESGLRIIDEVHQDFHLNFKLDLYTHVQNSISLSATLLSHDDFMTRMYEVAYPNNERFKGLPYHKYVSARAVLYRLKYPNKVRFKDPGSNKYSHTAFEKSVMRIPDLAENYANLINRVVEGGSFFKEYKKGDRIIIFCSTISMCTYITAYMKALYPDLDVRRYVEDDPFENTQEAEMIVSTLQSAGTAIDIPQLTTVVMTTAIDAIQGNVQGFGRLRELKDGRTPHFYYFVCEDIPKHMIYHERKRVILRDRAIAYREDYVSGNV